MLSYVLIKQLVASLARSVSVVYGPTRVLGGNGISTTCGEDQDSGSLIPSSLQLLEASMCPVVQMLILQNLLFMRASLTKRTSGFKIAAKKPELRKGPAMQASARNREGAELQRLPVLG